VVTDKLVVLTTCESLDQARTLARALVERRLAACVNILPGATSIYRWHRDGKDAIEEAPEILLLIKSRRDVFPQLQAAIAHLHTYEIPEAIALPITAGSDAYLNWLDRETAQ
jgi:periplasmic divalent cation tolerance protein